MWNTNADILVDTIKFSVEKNGENRANSDNKILMEQNPSLLIYEHYGLYSTVLTNKDHIWSLI